MATVIAATGDPWVDTVAGITDREWLDDGLMGLAAVPATDLRWIFDLGSGDGKWSKVATSYAIGARVVSVDWRMAALAAVQNESLYRAISTDTPVWRPISYTIDGVRVRGLEMAEVEAVSLSSLLADYGADPAFTAVRYQGEGGLPALVDGFPGLRMFTGILVDTLAAFDRILETLHNTFTKVSYERRGEVLYVRCYSERTSGDSMLGTGLGDVAGGDAPGDPVGDNQPG